VQGIDIWLIFQRQNEIPIQDYWYMMYNELNTLNEERFTALENIICQKEKVAKYNNKKIRIYFFGIGVLIWKVILPMDKKLKFLGKWSQNWDRSYVIEKVISGNAYVIQEVITDNYIGSINGKYF